MTEGGSVTCTVSHRWPGDAGDSVAAPVSAVTTSLAPSPPVPHGSSVGACTRNITLCTMNFLQRILMTDSNGDWSHSSADSERNEEAG